VSLVSDVRNTLLATSHSDYDDDYYDDDFDTVHIETNICILINGLQYKQCERPIARIIGLQKSTGWAKGS
jgi:hypothetical protein